MRDYPPLMTLTEAAKMMGKSRSTASRAHKKKMLPTVSIGGREWVIRDQLKLMIGMEPDKEVAR